MTGSILRRVLGIPFLVLLLAWGMHLLLSLAPQDTPLPGAGWPAGSFVVGPDADPQALPSFGTWVACLVDGSLPSLKRPGFTLRDLLAPSLPITATLVGLSMVLALGLGVPLGIGSALRQGSRWDKGFLALAALGISVPPFVLGPCLVLGLSLALGWLPPARWDGPASAVLPVLTLGAAAGGWVARLTRAGLLDVLQMDFVRTAAAKGLPPGLILRRHVLRGGLVPLVSALGPLVAGVLTATVVVEKIFLLPGAGYYFVEAALDRDYTMVLGVVTLYGAVLMLLNLATDVAVAWLDPRTRLP